MRSSRTRLAALLIAAAPAGAFAHGASIGLTEARGMVVEARYDTGDAMSRAQVAVFAPDDPAAPWLTGVTDEQGRFSFVPDGPPGQWAVQVRQAGHGAMGHFLWGADGATSAPAAPATTTLQRLVMIGCVLWGCIGTALYFRRPRRSETAG